MRWRVDYAGTVTRVLEHQAGLERVRLAEALNIIARIQAVYQIVLRADGRARWSHTDGNFNPPALISSPAELVREPAFYFPVPKVPLDGLGQIARMGFANIDDLPAVAVANHIRAGLVAQVVEPWEKLPFCVRWRPIDKRFHLILSRKNPTSCQFVESTVGARWMTMETLSGAGGGAIINSALRGPTTRLLS